jgi:crossover junction endodeoxyribonuclease RusA
MTKNMVRRLHFQREAQLRREAITEARWTIRAALRRGEIQPMIGANVTLHWRQGDNRRRDGDGAQPTLSLVIDALVLEGVLPDDSWVHVVHSGVTCHPPRRGLPGAMWLELSDPGKEAEAS